LIKPRSYNLEIDPSPSFIGSIDLKLRRPRKIYCRVYKTDDEWFYVTVENNFDTICNYYKCDQFDGLLKLIELISNPNYIQKRLNESLITRQYEYWEQISVDTFCELKKKDKISWIRDVGIC
jgi:hypothetical protein